jgi:hypothetical protein
MATFIDTKELNVKEPREGWKGRFFHSPNMTSPTTRPKPVPGFMSIRIRTTRSGTSSMVSEITIAGQARVLGPGCAAVVPPDTSHYVKALSNVRAIVVDYPRRDSIGGINL